LYDHSGVGQGVIFEGHAARKRGRDESVNLAARWNRSLLQKRLDHFHLGRRQALQRPRGLRRTCRRRVGLRGGGYDAEYGREGRDTNQCEVGSRAPFGAVNIRPG
jgi:hypothetical protein